MGNLIGQILGADMTSNVYADPVYGSAVSSSQSQYNNSLSNYAASQQQSSDYQKLYLQQQQTGYVTKKEEKKSMFKEFKSYVLQHKDLFFGVVVALALDSLVLDGELRGRLVAVLHKILDRAEKLVDKNEISS